jgi:2-amino-4-hydroxy-6-hydroxymethyldihydropteridine diphosphokinase
VKYVISLGSNLGDRLEILKAAVESIRLVAQIEAVSSFYETDPVGGPEQPDYLNAVLIASSYLTPELLLTELQKIESAAGRTREIRWGARTLDLDLITAEDIEQENEFLTLPHPRAHERAFVLQPWLEIDPEAQIPGKGWIKELLSALDSQE